MFAYVCRYFSCTKQIVEGGGAAHGYGRCTSIVPNMMIKGASKFCQPTGNTAKKCFDPHHPLHTCFPVILQGPELEMTHACVHSSFSRA
eukprot:SAG25_NODE_1687_length_2548_cov_6.811862_3_plen_89_part_00